MKLSKALILTVSIGVMGLAVSDARADDVAVNGGFETGDFTGWDQFPTGPGQQTIVSPGAAGNFAACISNTVAPSASVLKNVNLGEGLIPAGATVTVSFDAKGSAASGGVAFAELFSEIAGGGVSASEILGGAPLALDPDPNTWKSFSFVSVAGPDPSGGMTVQFAAVTGAVTGSQSTICVDNLTVLVEGVVPNEESNWGVIKSTFK